MSGIVTFVQFLFPRLYYLLSPCVVILVLLVMERHYFKDMKKTVLYIIFSMYMIAVFRVTGLPDSLHMHFNPRLWLYPFYGIQDDLFNAMLNVFLFIPFGFFLPALWRQFFSFKNTLITAVCFTALIEISQLFCNRLTDINDIITNTTGALIGYGFLQLLIKPFPNLFQNEFKKRECLLIFAITFSVVFFLDPAIYNFLFYFKLLPSYYFKH